MFNREALSCPPPRKRSRLIREVRTFSGFINFLTDFLPLLGKDKSLKRKGQSGVQDDINIFLKRTYSPIHLFSYSPHKRPAFTLAEVLITLGIIGVVAAMTMPSVIGHYKRQETLSRLKKAYTTINQALKLSETENGEYVYWDTGYSLGPKAYIEKYWLPYFNVLKVCNTHSECGYENNQPYTYMNGQKADNSLTYQILRIPFITTDGILYSISVRAGNDATKDSSIFIDINGSKGPNIIGKDYFIFTRVAGKGILPQCYEKSKRDIDADCSSTGKGNCCAQRIIMNGWQFPKDYPY